jgi:hypothetical protein
MLPRSRPPGCYRPLMPNQMNSKTNRQATSAQLGANRRNSLLSTGPVTAQGKAASSRNALKTGLTGRTVLLPNEDAALYEHHLETLHAQWKPVGEREAALVQSIADAKWRLARIPGLEYAIHALGYKQFAAEFAEVPASEAGPLIEARTFLAFHRQLMNLNLQESRLRRQCEKDVAELRSAQDLRRQIERAKAKVQAAVAVAAPKLNVPPAEIGFEFSTPDFDSLEDLDSGAPLPLTIAEAA